MPKTKKQLLSVVDPREALVAQGNDLIRHARFKLTALEQNIIYFAISKIKPTDKDFMRLSFTVAEFCKVCGIKAEDGHQGGKEYRRIKKAVKAVSDKSAWTVYPNGMEELVRWFDTFTIQPKTGEMSVVLSQSMKPYLIGLIERAKAGGEGYTQATLLTYLALQSKYSKRLYEILKSYLYSSGNQEKLYKAVCMEYDLGELMPLLSADNYKRYQDLRRFVLDTTMREINAISDIAVSYVPIKQGRKITGISFAFQHKQISERLSARVSAIGVLDSPIEGQLSLNDSTT
jgi:plasmid replication initiation protein